MQVVLVVVNVEIRIDLVLGHAEEIAAVLIDALAAMQQEVTLRVGDEHACHAQQLLGEIREVLLRVEFQQHVIDGQPFRFFQHLPCLHKKKKALCSGMLHNAFVAIHCTILWFMSFFCKLFYHGMERKSTNYQNLISDKT